MGRKVLVIDDSPTVRQQVRMTLEQAGYTIIEAVDGQDGAEKIQANADVAMAICDINMPRMNGIELLGKAQTIRPALPIVMLTTEGQPALIKQARELGAKGWIVKPFKAELLVAAVQKLAG